MRLETYGIAAAPPEVRTLFDRQMSPESSWDWFETLAATTLSDREEALVLALVDSEGSALAAMPVIAVGGRVIRGLTSPFTTLFAPPLGDNGTAGLFGRLLAAKVGTVLRLDALDGAQGAAHALQEGLGSGGLVVLRFRHFANWFERILDFSDFWNSRGSQLKSTVKRKSAALLREGRLSFEMIDLVTGWQDGAQIYNTIYAKSWKPAEPHPQFIDRLLQQLGSRGIARLAVARIDDVPAAAQVWLVKGNLATIFKLAHDPAFDRQSPGTLLTHWVLERLHESDGVRDVDFGRGDDPYKRSWLSSSRDRVGLLAANPRSFKGLMVVLFDILPSRFAVHLRGGRPAAVQS